MSDNAEPYPIVLYPAPLLKKRAREVTAEELKAGRAGELDLRELAARMVVTMRLEDGLGLAAPQVGVSLRAFVANPGPEGRAPVFVFNPVLSEKSGSAVMEEGCLSVPGIRAKVKRAERVVLTGLDLDGKPLRLEASGLEARIYQHELDHLDGVLILQRMGTAARFMHRERIRELEDEYELHRRSHAARKPAKP